MVETGEIKDSMTVIAVLHVARQRCHGRWGNSGRSRWGK
jgi:hypothetical protein